MKISSFGYSIRQGVKNIRRNFLFSLASIGTIIACLFVFGLFYCVLVNFRAAIHKIESSISISVFFDEGLTESSINLIGEQIKTRKEVNTIDYISPEQAWEEFSEQTYDDPEAARAAFGDDNPLAHSASYKVTLTDASKQADFIQFLESIDGVRKVSSSTYTADSISAINAFVGYASFGIILILLLVSVFLINNTITIGITVRREEIRIMKLIGATNSFIRAPFIIEGIIIGLLGSIVPLILLYYLYDIVINYIAGKFSILNSLFEFAAPWDMFKSLIPITLLIGIGIGFFGSLITTKKHLKI
ncbi:MAG: permease-like cell division protein FtsX [Eubacterium sp.]|nr:permease-like cell division protein FtsX [Eubacterium sp.]MBR1772525.1 permease-like cell division protein FtsX [Eubacterium sp.]